MVPIADFSNKKRVFKFCGGNTHVDLGRCSGYWTMPDGRRCVSETSIDRSGRIFETYFFALQGLENKSAQDLFELVKAAHLNYEHVSDIGLSTHIVADRTGTRFHALVVCIADAQNLFRMRPPTFRFYYSPDIPLGMRWTALDQYRQCQVAKLPFLVIEDQSGSPSWGDSTFYRIATVASVSELKSKLQAVPSSEPAGDYSNFNLGVIDARDLDQPFNETVYSLTPKWLLENPDMMEHTK
ncbi:hypothetical protein N9L47_01005 [Rhodobacteraceae bacterium]|nr:hypothetical protein [Paracoccaceae bacterium]